MMTLALLALVSPQIDQAKLDALVQRAKDTKSDCVVVLVDGKVVVDKWFHGKPRKIEAMSATKSVVNIAIGMLIKDGKIKSVDDPVQKYFPNYKGGGKEAVTIRHLLEHSSGIEANSDTGDIYSSWDFIQNAIEKPLVSKPGEKFFYNNRAVNLLAGVATKAAGMRFDKYLKPKLFDRLGIKDYEWTLDVSGNPQGMAGLQIRPEDFAKIGMFMLRGGGRLLPEGWIADSTRASAVSLRANEPCGWLWWPIKTGGVGFNDSTAAAWKKAGIRQELIDKLAPLKGKSFERTSDYFAAFREQFKGDEKGMAEINDYFVKGKARVSSPIQRLVDGYSAEGYLGQYLVVIPSAKLVAVRMREAVNESEDDSDARTFFGFPEAVYNLIH